MPRKRQTRSGADAQKIASVPGRRYGEGVESAQLQAAMPTPSAPTAPTAPTSAVPQEPAMVAPAPPVDPAQIQAFLQQNRPALLSSTRRPEQPVTAGMASGPGPGPEIIGRSSTPLARYFQQLSAQTGNEKWRRLAERAGL